MVALSRGERPDLRLSDVRTILFLQRNVANVSWYAPVMRRTYREILYDHEPSSSALRLTLLPLLLHCMRLFVFMDS